MFSQKPPKGVYSGMIACAHSQRTSSGVLWPVRLSQISRRRSGGSAAGSVKRAASPAYHASPAARTTAGSGSTLLGARSTGRSRTWPVAGRGCQEGPGCGIAW